MAPHYSQSIHQPLNQSHKLSGRPLYSSFSLGLKANSCFDENETGLISQKKVFISCSVPGELDSVTGVVIFCYVMRLNNVNVAIEVVLTELLSWYSSVHVKYGYPGDN